MVFYLVLKSVNCVSRMYKGCLKFQGCFKEVLRVFSESFKGKFPECFKSVSRKFQECLRKFQGYFKGV